MYFEIKDSNASRFVLSQGGFAGWGPVWFHTTFGFVFPISVKNSMGVLVEVALPMWNPLDSIDIFAMLRFSFHEQLVSFYLSVFFNDFH